MKETVKIQDFAACRNYYVIVFCSNINISMKSSFFFFVAFPFVLDLVLGWPCLWWTTSDEKEFIHTVKKIIWQEICWRITLMLSFKAIFETNALLYMVPNYIKGLSCSCVYEEGGMVTLAHMQIMTYQSPLRWYWVSLCGKVTRPVYFHRHDCKCLDLLDKWIILYISHVLNDPFT